MLLNRLLDEYALVPVQFFRLRLSNTSHSLFTWQQEKRCNLCSCRLLCKIVICKNWRLGLPNTTSTNSSATGKGYVQQSNMFVRLGLTLDQMVRNRPNINVTYRSNSYSISLTARADYIMVRRCALNCTHGNSNLVGSVPITGLLWTVVIHLINKVVSQTKCRLMCIRL